MAAALLPGQPQVPLLLPVQAAVACLWRGQQALCHGQAHLQPIAQGHTLALHPAIGLPTHTNLAAVDRLCRCQPPAAIGPPCAHLAGQGPALQRQCVEAGRQGLPVQLPGQAVQGLRGGGL